MLHFVNKWHFITCDRLDHQLSHGHMVGEKSNCSHTTLWANYLLNKMHKLYKLTTKTIELYN